LHHCDTVSVDVSPRFTELEEAKYGSGGGRKLTLNVVGLVFGWILDFVFSLGDEYAISFARVDSAIVVKRAAPDLKTDSS
jgi:hypothetical protein